MTKPICAAVGCIKRAHARGFCNAHYQRVLKYGMTELPGPKTWRYLRSLVGHIGDDCVIWPFARKSNGYGTIPRNGRPSVASREMCRLAHGEPPTPAHEAAHSCGNGHLACVNPTHLSWKTHQENVADMLSHGTRMTGEKNAAAKLTASDVIEIRQLYASMSCEEIASRFHVSGSNVWLIATRQSWRHVQ